MSQSFQPRASCMLLREDVAKVVNSERDVADALSTIVSDRPRLVMICTIASLLQWLMTLFNFALLGITSKDISSQRKEASHSGSETWTKSETSQGACG